MTKVSSSTFMKRWCRDLRSLQTAGSLTGGARKLARTAALGLMLVTTASGFATASACSTLSLQPLTIDYDPTSPAPTTAIATIQADRWDSTAETWRNVHAIKPLPGNEPNGISFDLDFVAALPRSWQSGKITSTYHGYPSGVFSPQSSTVIYAGYYDTDDPVALQVRLSIAPGQTQLSAGTHALNFAIADRFGGDVGCPFGNFYTSDWNEAFASATLNVAEILQMNLKGGGLGGTMDFGTSMETGDQQFTLLSVTTNAPFRVIMASDHGGVLKLNDEEAATDEIAYTATFNGQPISATTPYEDLSPVGTGYSQSDLEFEVTLTGDTQTKRAGKYKDTVTLTLQSAL
ncbi:hypothetical protein [Ponticaulis profundi]|uniref:Spore coat protein U domain-containing protein n=1 Tax=Ponticaulis profundi TaxID=2665222 RepID=A0ABW1SCU3_9PROT